MTQEEKQLLIKDLCARLPYDVKGRVYAETTKGEYDINGDMIFFNSPFDVIKTSYQRICDWLDGRHIEQKVLPGFDGLTPEEKMNHPLYLEGFDVGRDVQKVFDEQKPEWSEEDERKYQCIRNILLTDMDKKVGSWKYSEILEWYEKRGIGRYTNSKLHWKPSEEQMKAIKHAYNSFPNDCSTKSNLRLLYHDLEKLM